MTGATATAFPQISGRLMKELIRTNDIVLISWLQATLQGDGIEAVVFDQYASAIEGQVGPVQRRVMVLDEDFARAQWIMNHERPQPA
jgi:Putative prokaryotic signal transducing protein